MTHTYNITGITCSNCEADVKGKLLTVPSLTSAEISKSRDTIAISMDTHISLGTLQAALGNKYVISVKEHSEIAEQTKSWFSTYKPILLIFFFISIIAFISGWERNTFNWPVIMMIFMSGFFLSFSFFKMLDLDGFAESYATYDIIAMRFKGWGYIYAFIEFGLGIAYAVHFDHTATNSITLLVMSVSIIGVLQSVLNKQKIRCACLGTVFNLPMSTITIIEDLLMIIMSAAMLLFL